MDLNFKQNELSFLNVYANCIDSTSVFTDKFQIVSLKDSEDIAILQRSSRIDLYTILKGKNPAKEKFILTYETKQFSDILKYCNANDDIQITSQEVKFGKKSSYQFESYDFTQVIEEESLLSLINGIPTYKTIELQDMNKISLIKSYLGEEREGLNVIGFFDNHFVISNRLNGTGIVKTKNKINESHFLPVMLYSVCMMYKLDTIKIHLVEGNRPGYLIMCDKTYMFFNKLNEDEIALPNIFEDQYKSVYDHPNTITINKDDFLKLLKKISIVTKAEYENRIFITFNPTNLVLETRDVNKCMEEFDLTIPKELQLLLLVLTVTHTISMISLLPGKEVIVKAPNDMDNFAAIMLTTKEQEISFIQNLHSDSEIIKK